MIYHSNQKKYLGAVYWKNDKSFFAFVRRLKQAGRLPFRKIGNTVWLNWNILRRLNRSNYTPIRAQPVAPRTLQEREDSYHRHRAAIQRLIKKTKSKSMRKILTTSLDFNNDDDFKPTPPVIKKKKAQDNQQESNKKQKVNQGEVSQPQQPRPQAYKAAAGTMWIDEEAASRLHDGMRHNIT